MPVLFQTCVFKLRPCISVKMLTKNAQVNNHKNTYCPLILDYRNNF